MSNSSLVEYTQISPNKNSPRKYPISKITIHHMAGNLSLETLGSIVSKPSRQMSCNYGIDSDGRRGLYCDEKDRSWCSSSSANDHRAITIEVANDEIGGDWHVSDKAVQSLIDLCVDICKRNGMPGLTWTGDSSGTLTCHYMFASTACPGPYLKSKMAWIAEEVTRRVNAADPSEPTITMLDLNRVPIYISSSSMNPSSTKTGKYYLWSSENVNGRVRITNSPERVGVAGQVTGWIDAIKLSYPGLKAVRAKNVSNLTAFYLADLATSLKVNYDSGYVDEEETTQTCIVSPLSNGDYNKVVELCKARNAIYESYIYAKGGE